MTSICYLNYLIFQMVFEAVLPGVWGPGHHTILSMGRLSFLRPWRDRQRGSPDTKVGHLFTSVIYNLIPFYLHNLGVVDDVLI